MYNINLVVNKIFVFGNKCDLRDRSFTISWGGGGRVHLGGVITKFVMWQGGSSGFLRMHRGVYVYDNKNTET